MRYKGKPLRGPKVETLVIPRESGDIVFQARAIMDYSPFVEICPEPDVPDKLLPGGKRVPNPDHPEYKLRQTNWFEQRQLWMILQSLAESKDLEWETVDLQDPATFNNYWDELAEGGFNEMERLLIRNLALKANSVDADKMEEARERFLREQQGDNRSTSQTVEVKNTPSGEPVSDLESSLQV